MNVITHLGGRTLPTREVDDAIPAGFWRPATCSEVEPYRNTPRQVLVGSTDNGVEDEHVWRVWADGDWNPTTADLWEREHGCVHAVFCWEPKGDAS